MEKDPQNIFWDSFARKYDDFIAKYIQKAYNELFKLIKTELKNNYRVLEIGTGTGIVALEIAGLVEKIVAVDYSSEMIRVAKEKLSQTEIDNVEFRVSRASMIGCKDKEFDVIIASNVFHLIPNPESVLQEIERLLRDDGRLILATYCHGENLKTKIISSIMGLSGFKAVNRWSITGFKEFIEKNGFKIETEKIIEDKIPLSFIVAKKL
jgi:ubiquinone/menaquinone biosynthesis C-methylase UbiE